MNYITITNKQEITQLKAILKFTAKDDTRPTVSETIFCDGNKLVATNGRILITANNPFGYFESGKVYHCESKNAKIMTFSETDYEYPNYKAVIPSEGMEKLETTAFVNNWKFISIALHNNGVLVDQSYIQLALDAITALGLEDYIQLKIKSFKSPVVLTYETKAIEIVIMPIDTSKSIFAKQTKEAVA